MSKAEILKKLYLYKQNPNLVKEVSNNELADLVVLVMTAVKSIEDSMESKRVDVEKKYDTQAKQVLSKAEKDAQALLKEVTVEVNKLLDKGEQTLGQTATQLEQRVSESIANLRNGENGIVTEAEIERAAAMALGMLELPDFDALVTEAITSNSEAIRNALELLTGDNRYKVEIADVEGLAKALDDLALIRSQGGGGIGKQQVYNFIRQAIADGTITSSGITDGDKGDITVSDSGATWEINADSVGVNELDTTGTPDGTKFLRDDLQWTAIPGGGDMLASTYDPQAIAGDAFDTDNHTDGTTNKVFTATEKTKLGNIEAAADVTDAGNVGSVNAAAASKATPVNADSFPIVNSESSNVIGRVTFTNFKAFLKTYFDTLYAAALGADDNYVTDAEKAALHAAVTVTDSTTVNLTLTGQDLTAEVIDGTITLAKQANVATGSVFYRKTAGAGAPEVQTLATLKTDLGLTGTNSGDQTTIVGITGTKAQFDTAVTDGNFLYVGDVTTNATHTGEVTGSGALTVDKTAITNKTAVTAEGTDYVLISDTSDGGNLKKALASDLGGGGGNNYFNNTFIDQSGGTSDTYGVLAGTINGSNALFTVSQAEYATGTLKVWLNGQLMTQGTDEDFVETTPASGTFTFNTAPATGSLITAEYQTVVLSSTTLLTTASVLDDLAGVVITAPSATQVLKYNGTNWVNDTDAGAASGTQTINTEAAGSATLTTAEISISTANVLNIVESNAASQTITLPTADAGDVGKWYQIYNKGTNRMTITSASTLLGDSVVLAVNSGCVAYITSTGNYTLVGTGNQTQEIQIPCVDWTTDLTVGDGKYYLRIPAKFNGWEITGVHAEVITAGTTGTTDIQLHNVTDAVDILSTKLTIDSTETGSDTAATAAVINASNKNLATEDRIRVDVDAISTTAPKGLIVSLTIQPL